ncbi:MAG TPA: MBL fold metallo-hydrolase [Chthoniobacterales bacterium]|nr:MBL fold metallo-hydrolase [Chthoniobacterales bacterium]
MPRRNTITAPRVSSGRSAARFQRALFLLLVLFAPASEAGLARYAQLVVADAPNENKPRDGIRITYLGVNGYQFESGAHALLVDPYFTRANLWSVLTHQPIAPERALVAEGLTQVHPRVDAILVTHAHFDHLLDVPEIARRTGAEIFAGATAVNLVGALGFPRRQCTVVRPGERRTIGPWKMEVLAAEHDHVFGSKPPFPGTVPPSAQPPRTASDWKLGEPLAFIIEANGQRIYIESGGVPGPLPPRVGRIDLAILGVALPDSRRRFADAVRWLQPRYILPSHQDDFFLPVASGFTFGKLTDFPGVRRTYEREALPGRLILLDYFRPWTLR